MVLTGKQAYGKLLKIEAGLPDIVMTLLGQSVSISDDRHPSYNKIGHICDINVSITSCHLQVHLNDDSSKSIVKALEVGNDTEGHPWFQMDEVELIGAMNAPVH